MSKNSTASSKANTSHSNSQDKKIVIPFPYFSIRTVTPPVCSSDSLTCTVRSGTAPAQSFMPINDNENVREYLLGVEGRKRVPTQVHTAIQETLKNRPDYFPLLNGGITIVVKAIEVDDKKGIAYLTSPSIINGSQTKGILQEHLVRHGFSEDVTGINVRYEIIESDNDDLIADISIARNFQNDVQALSIAGRKGYFDEIDKKVFKPRGKRLRTSETDPRNNPNGIGNDYIDTEKLLQVLTALRPNQLWGVNKGGESPNKAFTYASKARCLKEYQNIFEAKEDKDHKDHKKAVDAYAFYLDVAADAWDIYENWSSHQGFKGTGIQNGIDRDEKRNILFVSDGIIFPIIASLSAFAKLKNGKWVIEPPTSFDEERLIRAAIGYFTTGAKSNPGTMGKSVQAYNQLWELTSLYQELSPT